MVFSYRPPNNTPLFLHERARNWTPLFSGPAGDEMRPAFGLPPLEARVRSAMSLTPSHDVLPEEARMALLLLAVRGRWLPGQEIELAERTALTVPEILDSKDRAIELNLLSLDGRLTDAGQRFVRAGRTVKKTPPTIPTRAEPYYPVSLRAPR